MSFDKPSAIAQMFMVTFAFACLTYSHVVSDFSVLNVVQNSHSMKPMLYKVAGVWGNHEGSMLLWGLVLALFSAAVAVFGRNLPPTLKARVLSIQAMIGFAFIAFIIFTSNPFARLSPAPPADLFRLGGLVEEGSVRTEGATTFFVVTDLNRTILASYTGVLPDLFREGQGVVAEGTIGADGRFTAREVLAKHDETYMPKEVADALRKSGQWREGEATQ